MLFDDALATEEIIYSRQKNIATSGKWVRTGKYVGRAWSCLKVLFQDQPQGEWVKSREVAIKAASNPGEIWNGYILDTRSKGCRYANLLGVKKQKKKLEDRGNRSPVRTRYTPVLKSYVPCIVFYNITVIDQLFCTTPFTPNNTQISPPTRFAIHWCHLHGVSLL
jgi:hypothetical protein